MHRKSYVDIKNGLKFKNLITNKSAKCRPPCIKKLCKRRYFYQIYSLQLKTLGAFKIFIFRSTSLKFDSLNWKLYLNFKKWSQSWKSDFKRVFRPLSPVFLKHLVYFLMMEKNKLAWWCFKDNHKSLGSFPWIFL